MDIARSPGQQPTGDNRRRGQTLATLLALLALLSSTLLACADNAAGGAICGNLLCEAGEDDACRDCAGLSPTTCGDGRCENGENSVSCHADCLRVSDLEGEWQTCDPFEVDPERACANPGEYGDARISANTVLTNPGYEDPCQYTSIVDVAGVVEVRTCAPRAWSRLRGLVSRVGDNLAFYYATAESETYVQPHPAPEASSTHQCATLPQGTEDLRCDGGVPTLDLGVSAAFVGAWRKCGNMSDEPSAAVACAADVRDEYLVLEADGRAVLGCARIDAEVSQEGYTLRACGGFLGFDEVGLRGSVLLSSDGTDEYLRIDDPFQNDGYDHYVRVDPSAALEDCDDVIEARCGL